MLNDSGSEIDEEFLGYFIDESVEVLQNLGVFVCSFKDREDKNYFEKFGQQVDRIMGAAYTLSLITVGDLARTGKEIGYKSSQIDDIGKLLSVQSLLSQLVKALNQIMKCFNDGIQPNFIEHSRLLSSLRKASKDLGDLRTTLKH